MQANLVNGWREVLTRIFAGFDVQYSVTPEWLINPDTNRRLKLDYLYPEVGIAVRFIGMQGPGRKRRKSDEEVAAEDAREDNREAVCREHGIALVSIDPDGEPRDALRAIEQGLTRAASRLALAKRVPQAQKVRLMPMLSQARQRAGEFTARLPTPEALGTYAELWWDRQAALQASGPAQPPPPRRVPRYRAGMPVVHERFGPGQVTAVEPDGKDCSVTVDFADGSQRTFLASIAGDKLRAA